jgi:hypothetical protein
LLDERLGLAPGMASNCTVAGWQFIEISVKIDSEKQGKDPQLIVFFPTFD